MQELLRIDTEKRIGFKIKTRGDCERLVDLISDVTGVLLSYNTLRRFFNLDEKVVSPRASTLDALALFNGYLSYTDYVQSRPFHVTWRSINKIYELIYLGDEKALLAEVNAAMECKADFIDVLPGIVREFILSDKIDLLDALFQQPCFRCQNFVFSEMIHLSSSIGYLFRSKEINEEKLLENSNFLRLIYSMFVDYSALNGYYGRWTEQVNKTTKDIEMQIFSACVIQLKNYLNKQPFYYPLKDDVSIEAFHPILKSRVFALQIICNPTIDLEAGFDCYLSKLNLESYALIDYFYELIFSAMLTRNFYLMKLIKSRLSSYVPPKVYYLQLHFNYLNLMLLLLAKYEGNDKDVKKYHAYIDLASFRSSYKELNLLFYSVFLYHTERGAKKSRARLDFQDLSRKLAYPIFDEAYLTKYFALTKASSL